MSRDQRAGFAAPLDQNGSASLYGPPPWHFAGQSLTVLARCDPAVVDALIPPPLERWGDPIVRFSVHALVCDFGFGWRWAQLHPEQAQFHEAVVGIAVRHGDRAGYWDPFLWTDSDAELAVGREMYGWPQRAGTIALTTAHPQNGWTVGDRVVGLVSRLGRPVFEIEATLNVLGDWSAPAPPFAEFFTERVLPDPASDEVVREVFASTMRDVRSRDHWHGPARLTLAAPELSPLAASDVIGGRWNTVAWTKAESRLVARSVQASR